MCVCGMMSGMWRVVLWGKEFWNRDVGIKNVRTRMWENEWGKSMWEQDCGERDMDETAVKKGMGEDSRERDEGTGSFGVVRIQGYG